MNRLQAIRRWRTLSPEEQAYIHLKRIPRHVAMSLAMEGEPVDESLIKAELDRRNLPLDTLKQHAAS